MRIASVFKDGTANAWYRSVVPFTMLQQRGHHVTWMDGASMGRLATQRPQWELLHMQQFWMPEDLAIVRRLQSQGIAVAWDTDDDIAAVPRGSLARFRMGGRRGIRKHFNDSIEMARTANVMTTPSAYLGELYRRAGARHVEVLENHVMPNALVKRRPRHQGVVLGITAAGEHAVDFKKWDFADVLRRLLAEVPHLRIVSIGHDFKLRDPRYVFHRWVPIPELVRHEAEFDIGIAPLMDSPMNRARSNIKLKEYASAGAMWLASPIGPYVGMGEAQGGRLVEERAWFAAICDVVENRDVRAALQRRSADWAKSQTAEIAAKQWERVFRTAIAQANHIR